MRVTDLLCKVTTSDEVLEYCGAFLQLYREEAWYLERTAHWVERVGIGYVRERVVGDAANRAAAARAIPRKSALHADRSVGGARRRRRGARVPCAGGSGVADMDGGFAQAAWREIGLLDDIPRLGARTVATPHGDVAVFRTGGRRRVRAG